jgi:hypothetical protein
MTLIDIDGAASARRLQEIAVAGKAVLDARLRQVAEQTAQAREAAEGEEADLRAALERRADAARVVPDDEAKPRPRPTTLSLGGEEFAQARAAREEPKPAPSVSAQPAPNRTLRLGAPEDRSSADSDAPVRRRPPRTGGDDDMSGRSWLR